MKKVFLDGTCNESPWKNLIASMLKTDYFNSVDDDWTEDYVEEELKQHQNEQ